MHTLKGTAATIGAGPLAELAHAAEQAIGQNAPATTLEALLQPVDTACKALIAALQTALPLENEPDTYGADSAASAPIDTAAAQQLLDRLEALLADDDSEAIELFNAEASALRSLLGPALPPMKRALDSYDFVNALATLRKARISHPHDKEDPVHEQPTGDKR
jgi:two-component system sensor histidine kinase/response regulator